jgi:hypothetical protein
LIEKKKEKKKGKQTPVALLRHRLPFANINYKT